MQLTEIRINLCPTSNHGPATARGNGSNGHHPSNGHHSGCNGGHHGSRLRAFCSLTFDNTFVVRDVKLIEGNDGLFLAMPSRKLADHCPGCGEKNHLRARFCNQCGGRLNEERHLNYRHGNGATRLKLHADVAHPINARCRQAVERQVVEGYWREVERSKQPGYVPPNLDHEDFDVYDPRLEPPVTEQPPPRAFADRPGPNLRPVTAVH